MAVADEHSMPLLRIPYALSYIDIIVNIMNYIFEEQNPRVVLEKYIRDVLFEAYTDPGLMIERGNMLGLNADRTRYVAKTLRFADEDDPGGADVQALQREGIALAQFASAQSGLQHCIAVNTQANCSIFLDSDSESTLARLLPFIENAALAQLNEIFRQHRVCIGYGHSDGGLPGIRNTYASSLQALRAGRIFYPDRQVHHYGEMEIYCVMEKVIGNGEIAQLDGILEKIGNRELLDTLVAYFDFDASVEGAAAKLFAHKNTVKYRLHRIKDLTGLDIKSFSDAMKLYMAVVAHKIRRSRGHS
jgi:purine catabolism regulator